MKVKALVVWSLAVVAACYSGGRSVEGGQQAPPAEAPAAAAPAAAAPAAAAAQQAEAADAAEATRLSSIEAKLDELNRKLDTVIARGGGGGPGGPGGPPARPPRIEPDRSKTYAVPIDGDPFDGRADAKVTLVKGYDYACPYCEKTRGTLEELKKKYGKDLRVVYKQLVIHPRNAMVGALAFCAAARQGKHREMDRLIWDKGFNARQLDLTDVPLPAPQDANGQAPADPLQTVKCWDHPDGCKNVDAYAAELGLNMRKFKADLKGDCMAAVASDGRHFAQLGVSSTPTFFINGRYLVGAQPIETFSAVIDEELKKARERIAAGTPAGTYYQKWVVDQGQKSLTP